MKNKKREITLLIIGILGLVSLMVGATYAYFKAQIGPAAISDITTTTATTDNFTFSTDGEIVLNVTAENLANGQGNVQDSSIAKARLIANNKTNNVTKEYNVYFLIEENDIEYSSYTKDGTNQSFKTSKEKETFDLTGYEPVPEMVMSVRKNGSVYSSDIKRINKLSDNTYDITEEEGLYLIGENVSITSTKDVTDTWEVIITYKNLSTNQQLNVGHSLKGKIMITTEELLYEINDAEDLRQLSTEVNAGDTKEGKYYILTDDINLGEHEEGVSNFTPIGTNTNRFKGNFNGENHIINNLYIEKEDKEVGLFGVIENSKISNLVLYGEINKVIEGAGLVCYTYGEVTIENVHNYVNINATFRENYTDWVGGIVGYVKDSEKGILKIDNCSNHGTITNGGHAGGLVGYSGSIKAITIIKKSANYGNISSHGDAGGIVSNGGGIILIDKTHNEGVITSTLSMAGTAGLIGCAWAAHDQMGKIYILNSYNTGTINGTRSIVSGLAFAQGFSAVVLNSYNKSNVFAPSGNGIFGFWPWDTKSININNVFNIGESDRKVGHVSSDAKDYVFKNMYYLKGDGVNSGVGNKAIGLTESQMKNEEQLENGLNFVDELNNNIKTINLEEIDPILKDYTLVNWKLGEDGYPTLDF